MNRCPVDFVSYSSSVLKEKKTVDLENRLKDHTAFHWAWVILILCFGNLFINYGIRLGYGVVLPEMIRTLGFSRTQGGDIFNAYLFAYIVISPLTGYLTDRFGARKVISSFGVLLGSGTLLMGTSKSFGQACTFFALVGIGASGMWIPVLTIAQRWFTLKKRGMALGIMSTGFGLGFAVMGRIFPIIVERWNWRYCWYLLGVAALAMVVVNAFLLRSKPEDLASALG
jgi:sugar phosphate permease